MLKPTPRNNSASISVSNSSPVKLDLLGRRIFQANQRRRRDAVLHSGFGGQGPGVRVVAVAVRHGSTLKLRHRKKKTSFQYVIDKLDCTKI